MITSFSKIEKKKKKLERLFFYFGGVGVKYIKAIDSLLLGASEKDEIREVIRL